MKPACTCHGPNMGPGPTWAQPVQSPVLWPEDGRDPLGPSCTLRHGHFRCHRRPHHFLLPQKEENGLHVISQPACHALSPCYAEPSPSAAATVPAAAAAAPNTRGQPARPPSAPDAAGDQTDDRDRNDSRNAPPEDPNQATQLRVCLRSPRLTRLQASLVKLHQHDPIRP